MKKCFQIKSFITATFFLAAYLNVFATQASCNLPHFFELTQKSTHNHHHDNDESTSHHSHEGNSQHHNEKGEEKDNNCCNDKTSAFFASQGNPIISSVEFKDTNFTKLISINSQIICELPVANIKWAASYSLPPPKIPDIRVFIQSFII